MSILRSLLQRRRRQSENAGTDEAALRAIAAEARDVFFHINSEGIVTYASPSHERVFGYTSEYMIGKSSMALVMEEDRPRLTEAVSAYLANIGATELRQRVRAVHANGTVMWVESSAVVRPEDGSVVLVLRDICDRVRLEEELAALALQDALTGMANRRSFDQVLEREWSRTVREGSEMSLLLLDLDHFKQFNDNYGHQAGDDCLRTVARLITSLVSRPTDHACRYGGEELAVILGHTGREGAEQIAECLRSGVEALQINHARSSTSQVVTVSIGIATALARAGGTMRMPEGLLQAADHALYRAKNEGRNRISHTLLITPTT